jgi:NTP pyrophosphatase (non-canonical NTP hydrolase)
MAMQYNPCMCGGQFYLDPLRNKHVCSKCGCSPESFTIKPTPMPPKPLQIIQQEHKKWELHNFPDVTTDDLLLGIMEELGELCHSHCKMKFNIRTNENYEEGLQDAIGDIVLFLMGYCSLMGYNLQAIIEKTWDEVKQRDWVKYPEKGVPNAD